VAFKIEKTLTSLFGAYKLQSQGNLPRIVSETVQPTIDLNTHALAAAGLTSRGFGSGVPFLGVMATFTQEEDWYVIGANTQFVSGAGAEWCFLALDYIPPGGGTFTICQSQRFGTSATMNSTAAGEQFGSQVIHVRSPFWSRKGSKWQLSCSAVTGGITGTGYADMLYYIIEP